MNRWCSMVMDKMEKIKKDGEVKRMKFLAGVMIFSVLFLIILTPTVSAFKWCDWIPFLSCGNDNGKVINFNNKWVKDYSTENDVEIYVTNPYEVNTTVCEIVRNKTVLQPKAVYALKHNKKELMKEGKLNKLNEYIITKEKENFNIKSKIKDLKIKDKKFNKKFKEDKVNKTIELINNKVKELKLKKELKLNETFLRPIKIKKENKEYYAYCYNTSGEKYVKFGNHSTVVTYAENHIEIQYDNGTTIQDITLYDNTEQCLVNCYAYGHSIIYKNNTQLFEGVDFKDKSNNSLFNGKGEIYIKNVTYYNVTTPVYLQNCSVRNVTINTINGTETVEEEYNCSLYRICTNETYYNTTNSDPEYVCNPVIDYYYNKTKSKVVWVKYNYSNLTTGEYEWKIKLDKSPDKSVDWAFAVEGFSSDEIRKYWAWWNSSWTRKRVISNLTGEYPTMNITFDDDMQAWYADVRFLNSTENGELNYTLRNYYPKGSNYSRTLNNITPNISAYYSFDNGVNDDHTGLYNFTNYGSSNVSGFVNNARSFDGSTNYAVMSNFTDVVSFSKGSISIWFYTTNVPSGSETLYDHYDSDGRFYIFINGDHTFGAAMGNNGYATTKKIEINKWYFLTKTWDGSYFNITVNGEVWLENKYYSYGTNDVKSIYIGRSHSADRYYTGKLDEFVFYNETLTHDQIFEIYNSQKALFTIDTNNESSIYMYYGNNVTGLQTTSNASETFLRPIGSYMMDEEEGDYLHDVAGDYDDQLKLQSNASFVGGYIGSGMQNAPSDANAGGAVNTSVSSDFPTGDFNHTYLIWTKLTTISSGDRGIIWRGQSGTDQVSALAENSAGQYTSLHYSDDKSFNVSLFSGQWVHLGYTYNSNTRYAKLYINGTYNTTAAQHNANLNIIDQYLDIGNGVNRLTNGIVDEAYIYDRILTDEQINELYSMSDQTSTYVLGPEQDQNPSPIVILNSPSNNTMINYSQVTFNCTAYDNTNISKVNFYINGVINQTNNTVLNNTNYIFQVNLSEGSYNWTCEAYDSVNNSQKADEYYLTIDLYNPEINITWPYEGYTVTIFNQLIDLNWTINETNPDKCWYTIGNESEYTCYQESANTSNQTGNDGPCTLYYNGTYLNATSSSNDGNYTTYQSMTLAGDIYINYTIPQNAKSAVWYLKAGGNNGNFTISTLENDGILKLKLDYHTVGITDYDVDGYYYNGTNWVRLTPLLASNSNQFFDEAIYWVIEGSEKNFINCTDNHTTFNYPASSPSNITIYMYINDTTGKEGSDNVTIYKNTNKPFINITNPQDGDTISTVNYYVNWTINDSLTYDVCQVEYGNSSSLVNKTVNCTDKNTTLTFPSGQDYQLIRIYANDTLGNSNATEQINVTRSFNLPFVNITEPIGTQSGIFYPGDTLTLGYEMAASAGLSTCWYEYNGTNTTISCGNTTTTFTPKYGDENIKVCVTDGLGNSNCDNETWGYQAVLLWNETNKDSYTEGELMNFSALIYSTTGFTPYLILNGTSNLASIIDVNDDYYNITYTQYAPEVTLDPETIDYQWDIQILSASYKSTAVDVDIYNINIGDCGTYNNLLLNFTGVFDESTNKRIYNLSEENVTFGAHIQIFTADHSTQVVSYDYVGAEFHHKAFCTDLNFSLDYKVDAIADYYGNETYLAKRIWYMDNGVLPLDGRNLTERTKQNVTLYLLDPNAVAESPQSVVFRYYDSTNQLVYDAIVHVYRNNIGENESIAEIGRSKTNNKGDSVIDLSIDSEVYRETVTIDGTVVFDTGNYKVLTCTEYVNTYCIIDLGLGRYGGEELNTEWYEIDGGRYSVTVDKSSRTLTVEFNLSLNDSTNITEVVVYKSYYNGTYEEIASNTKVGREGEVSVVIPAVGGGNYTQLEDVYLYKIVKNQTTIAWGQFSLERSAAEFFGSTFSLFLALIMVMTLGLLAASGGTLQVVYVIVGVIATAVLGLVNYDFQGVQYGLVIYLIIAGGIIIWKLSSKLK